MWQKYDELEGGQIKKGSPELQDFCECESECKGSVT